MDFNFDIRGYLKPHGKNIIEQDDLKIGFVNPFDESSSRIKLFDNYNRYNLDLKSVIGEVQYQQWINGSFISTKVNPEDIDLVNIIDYQIVETYEKELEQFIKKRGKQKYGVDGYIVKLYPENHKFHVRTKSDLLYWQTWFSKTRINRRKKRFNKGFVEIQF